MQPKITVLTLGVNELEKSVAFYQTGLGFPTKGIVGTEIENGAVAFFDLQPGLKLALWPKQSIAQDTGLPLGGSSSLEMTIGHNVDSSAKVDQIMQQAEAAGATIIKKAQTTFYGGYAGYFQDPDGHVWEIAFNPQFADL